MLGEPTITRGVVDIGGPSTIFRLISAFRNEYRDVKYIDPLTRKTEILA